MSFNGPICSVCGQPIVGSHFCGGSPSLSIGPNAWDKVELWPIPPLPPSTTTVAEQTREELIAKGGHKDDKGKAKWSLMPFIASLEGVIRVLMFGEKKYAAWNWRKGMPYTRVTDATLRHIFSWLEGEDIDPDSGENHIDHALCELLFLRTFIAEGTGTDDRYKRPE